MALEALALQKTIVVHRYKSRLLQSRLLQRSITFLARSSTLAVQQLRGLRILGLRHSQQLQWLPKKLQGPCRVPFLLLCLHWRRYLINLIYTIIWFFYLVFFASLLRYFWIFARGESSSVSKNWTFGQIVGITVWAEPLVEFMYLEISKPPFLSFLSGALYALTRPHGRLPRSIHDGSMLIYAM